MVAKGSQPIWCDESYSTVRKSDFKNTFFDAFFQIKRIRVNLADRPVATRRLDAYVSIHAGIEKGQKKTAEKFSRKTIV